MTDEQIPNKKQVEQFCSQFLEFYADWVGRNQDNAIGYKRRTDTWNKQRTVIKTYGSPNITQEDELAMVIEEKILQIPEHEKNAILIHYLRPKELLSAKARTLRIAEKTLRNRIHSAYIYLYPLFLALARSL